MDKAFKRMRVVTPDRKKLAERILTKEAGWDGMLPIPVKWVGTVEPEDLHGVTLLSAEGIFWVGDPVSALTLFLNGYNLEKDPEILAKRDSIKIKGISLLSKRVRSCFHGRIF